MFSVIMGLWTYQQVRVLDHRQRAKAIARYRRDIRTIPTPVESAPINNNNPEVDLERGPDLPTHGISTDEAPPYESITNPPKDV
jgi:hypothetical protein